MQRYERMKTDGNTDWFVKDRFGMFIHFGLYSSIARGEWVKFSEHIKDEEYNRQLKYFDPDLYDPKEWAKTAKAAGMKYAVMTTKHHDGFCMFDSKYTDYKVTNTPAGRDLIREYVEAFRAEGLKVGLYYSLIDWHHPDFTVDIAHPLCDEENPSRYNQGRDMEKYREYLYHQVEELLTKYGKIDILWFDFSYPYDTDPKTGLSGKTKDDWGAEKLVKMIRRLQPDVIIDNRMGLDLDLWTPEQFTVQDWIRHPKTGERVTWEVCHTLSGDWGYCREEKARKTPEMLIGLLVHSVACGGNMIMNVGPTARGCFDERDMESLKVFEEWMKYNSRSIYNCTMAEEVFQAPNGCAYTQSEDGKRLYLHLLEYPFQYVLLPKLSDRIEYAQFLHDGSQIPFEIGEIDHMHSKITGDHVAILKIPPKKPNVTVPVVEIFLRD